MKKIILSVALSSFMIISFTACGNKDVKNDDNKKVVEKQQTINKKKFKNKNYVQYVGVNDIKRDLSKLGGNYKKYYNKYINYIAPNGKAILIVSANKVSDEQMLKAYNILSFYLTDTKDYKKKSVANSMANKGAVLNMPNGSDGDGKTPSAAVNGQPLYQMEVPVAGGKWYQKNDYKHRDAAYEEIFHMVHDTGIGTTKNSAALPELSKKIKVGMDKALPKNKSDWGKKGLWGLGSRDWLLELAQQNSLEQEYIVGGLDSFYGLWEAYTESDKGMWGMYVPKNREAVKEKDRESYDIINTFLGDKLTYMERIAPEFEGTFKMYLDKKEPYTYKSQYLQNARLTGNKKSNLEGNDFDNILLGNKASNVLDGKNGKDVIQFSGASTEYKINKKDNNIIVKDIKGRDGEDTLKNIEILRFTDKDIEVKEIK